ncbi:MAG: ABC transporter substrate-binding protein [Prolixibacteraceae bacterium]|nr:ABC transporter substrate-binding protein [Prolixibacteraceae bacterium]
MRIKNYIFIAIVILFAACNNTKTQPESETLITVATLKGPSSMGMIKLIDSISSVENSNIRITILNEPNQVRKMVLDGTADFAILPLTMGALTYNKGLEYKLIAIPVWGTLYLFGSDSTIQDWEHIKGKKIHSMAKGMTPDILLRYILTKNGIDPDKDVTLDYSFPTHIDLANAVAARQADIGIISEPMVSLVMKRNEDVKPLFDMNEEWHKHHTIPMAQTAFLGKKQVIEQHTQLTKSLINAYRASSIWVNENPEKAATLIVKHNILPDYEVALSSIPRSHLRFVMAKNIEPQINEYLNIFYEINPEIIGGKIPDENFIYK